MANNQSPRRTQAERTRASKEKIIKAASEYFAQQGYRGAKLSDIARAANLTEPGLLHHFPKKTELLMAVLAERDRVDLERFTFSTLPETDDPLFPYIKLVEHNETVPGLVQLFTTLVVESIQEEHPGHDFFLQRYHSIRNQIGEFIQQGQAKGVIRTDLPEEDLAVMIFAMMDGLQIQWLYEPEKVDMARIFIQFARLLETKNQ